LYQKTDLPTAVRKALTGGGERIRIDKPTNVVCRYAENPGRTLSCPDGERKPISGIAVLHLHQSMTVMIGINVQQLSAKRIR
jgi:hypothetical protein